jgi:hypothetical protein
MLLKKIHKIPFHSSLILAGAMVSFAFSISGASAYVEREVRKTKYGPVTIVTNKNDTLTQHCLFYQNTSVMCSGQDFLQFGGSIATKDYDVVFIKEFCGGTACTDGFDANIFLIISKKGFRLNKEYNTLWEKEGHKW